MERMITVFTPIYNRAYCIEKLYDSLKKQTRKNFEWLIIDDGSTDNVEEIVETWIGSEKEFPIRFYKVKNGGKMRAVNKGVQLSDMPAFFIVDSDDYLTENAMELLGKWFLQIKDDDDFAGVSGLRKITTIDSEYDFKYIDCTNLERRKYNLTLDMAECYKTEILRRYPAIEIEGENYLSPSYLWNSIAKDGYKLRYYNEYIYVTTYLPDGLSVNNLSVKARNPKGWAKIINLDIECKNDSEYSEMQYYFYYLQMHELIPKEEIANNLEINVELLNEIISNKPEIIRKINAFFIDRNIKRVALYGLGGEAKRFLQLLNDLNIQIEYGIDRSHRDLLPQCYSLSQELPPVDAVLITNRAGIKAIREDIKLCMNCHIISLQEDILEKSLNYYFSDI